MISSSQKRIRHFPLRTFLGLLALLLLVACLGLLAYRRLELIVNTAAAASHPENNRLLHVREIVSDLYDAENSAIMYSITRETAQLKNFSEMSTAIQPKLAALALLTRDDTTAFKLCTDLGSLVHQKFALLHSQLDQQQYSRTDLVLDELSQNLRSSLRASSDRAAKNQLSTADTARPSASKDGAPTTPTLAEQKEKVSNLFRWMMGAKPKETLTTKPVDSMPTPLADNPPLRTVQESRTQVALPASIERELQAFKKVEANRYRESLERDLALTLRNQEVSGAIRAVVDAITSHERMAMATKSLEVASMARIANNWVIVFCIAFSLFLLLIAIGIVSYFRSNKRQQESILAAKAEAESLADARARFLATMSHELRTPMNAIVGFSHNLLQTPLQPDQHAQLSLVNRAADHLNGLANTVMDYSRLEAGQMQYEQRDFDLREEAALVIDLLRPQFEEKGISLVIQLPATSDHYLCGDALRLRQILINLLNNSLKFTEKGSVALEIESLASIPDHCRIRFVVRDTGMGIPGERLGAIFNAFEQSDASISRKFGGAGLGLAITKMLVEQQGGAIGIDSAPGNGTTVWFELPFEVGDPTKLVPALPTTGGMAILEGKTALIADDEPVNRRLLREILEGWKMTCTEATNGQEAWERANMKAFDFILMDMRMPEMDGLQATRKIRLQGPSASAPIFMLTATVQPADLAASTAAGCTLVLAKPFQQAELLQHLIRFAQAAEPSNVNLETSKIPLFSLNSLKAMSRQNPEFIQEMVEGFIHSAEDCRKIIRLGFKGQNFAQMGEAAHKLAAPARHLEAMNLYHCLKEIEKIGLGNGDANQLDDFIAAFELELEGLIPALEKALAEDRAAIGRGFVDSQK